MPALSQYHMHNLILHDVSGQAYYSPNRLLRDANERALRVAPLTNPVWDQERQRWTWTARFTQDTRPGRGGG